jgi:hypothetical protein
VTSATTERYAPYLQTHLAPGERLLAAAPTKLPQGRTFSGSRAKGPWRAVENTLDAAAATTWLDGLLFGRAAAGSWESTAAAFALARDSDAPFGPVLVVTDRRLLRCGLTAEPLGHWTYRGPGGKAVPDDLVRLVHEVDRAAVAGARVGPHRLRPGRLRITFSDGSWLAFAGGRARRAGHEDIAAALARR